MISNALLAVGTICLLLALLTFFGIISLSAGLTPLLVVGIICVVAGYFLRGSIGRRL